jgi:hypothetical protein
MARREDEVRLAGTALAARVAWPLPHALSPSSPRRSDFLITHSGWVSAYSLKTAAARDTGGLYTALSAAAGDGSFAALPGTASTLPEADATIVWRDVALPSPVPLGAGTRVSVSSVSVAGGAVYASGIVAGSCDSDHCDAVAAFNVTLRRPDVVLSNDRGSPVNQSYYMFYTDPLTLPMNGYVTSYELSLAPWSSGTVADLVATLPGGAHLNVTLYRRWLLPQSASKAVQRHVVGISRDEWVLLPAGTSVYVMHTSLKADRTT